MKTIVALFGPSASGKDTVAKILQANLGHYPPILYFADPLKRAAHHLLGMPENVAYGSQQAKAAWTAYGKTAREWLQWLGTEIGRTMIHKDVWVHRLVEEAEIYPGPFVLVADGRFENEIVAAKAQAEGLGMRFVSIGISRQGLAYYQVATGQEIHPSEAEPTRLIVKAMLGDPVFDYLLDNNCDMPTLEGRVEVMIKELKLRG